jgi:hypothetical protein
MPPKTVPPRQPRPLAPEDFEAIQEAVMETPRGRWFLDQFATRLRAAETAQLTAGLHRLEKAVSANHETLMARLADALRNAPSAPVESAPQVDLAPKHMKFFKAEEEIFEPAPHARIAAVPAAPRLAEMALPPVETTEVKASAKRRIVIIRHKPGEEIDVPLAEDDSGAPPSVDALAKAS